MTNRLIHTPGFAYCTEDKGTKLKYGQLVYIKYFTPDGKYAITKGGKYESIRFSNLSPSIEMFDRPFEPNLKAKKVAPISYKQLYYDLLRDGRESYLNGTSEQFTKKLFKLK